jgi:DNA-binding Lrp family transcriptional regulator
MDRRRLPIESQGGPLMSNISNENGKKHRKPDRKDISEAIIEAAYGDSDRTIAREVGVSNRAVSQRRKKLEKAGEILLRVKSTQRVQTSLQEVCTYAIFTAPENDSIYDPIRVDDPAFLALVEAVRSSKWINRIGVSRDGYVFDGHRRLAVAKYLGLQKVPIYIRADISRRDDRDGFIRLLKLCNSQRVKTTAEVVREGIVGMEEEAWQRICEYREEKSEIDGVEPIILYGVKKRSLIRDKIGLKDAIVQVLEENKHILPISDRKVFYLLLYVNGLLRNDRQKTPFLNSNECYDDVTDMVTRLRIDGTIPFDSICDETRPVTMYGVHRSVGTFVEQELENLFSGYWRDLQQSQPNWIELLVEKNTVASSLTGIASKYTIPMTSGRGYSSLPPRKNMVDRFKKSGREKLVLIVATDYDPEGLDIPNSFGLSLRDDFGIEEERLKIIRAALTRSQIGRLSLHQGQLANEKKDGSRYKRFVELYGERCWELEAIPTDTLRVIVEDCIRNVMDLEAFEKELLTEKEEQGGLDETRELIRAKLEKLWTPTT